MVLKDKVSIITGSTSGMGVEEAKRFAKEGAKVAVSYTHLDVYKRQASSRSRECELQNFSLNCKIVRRYGAQNSESQH